MRDKSHDVQEIPPIPPAILEAAAAGKLVVFIGAGASRIIGCPSWKKFALLQLKDLREKGAINYYEYKSLEELDARKLLSICRTVYQEKNLLRGGLTSFFGGDEELIKKHGRLYEKLYAFNAIFVTTNYDDHLDREANKPLPLPPSVSEDSGQENGATVIARRGKVVTPKDGLLISDLNNGNVIHLHGATNDEGSTVITIVDYIKHYEYGSRAAVLLEKIFSEYTVLFVGYGLEEYEVMEFIISKTQTVRNEVRHFMLYPIFKKESNLLEFQRKYYSELGVELVPYSKDHNGYEQLVNVIEEWSSQIGPISSPQGFLERIRMIDEVI
jgi:hypothetical protein